MKPEQYHQVLIGIDRALFVIDESLKDLSPRDLELTYELQLVRSKILKAESGHPFPFKATEASRIEADPEITRAPWIKNA